jgi:hypothetical protein
MACIGIFSDFFAAASLPGSHARTAQWSSPALDRLRLHVAHYHPVHPPAMVNAANRNPMTIGENLICLSNAGNDCSAQLLTVLCQHLDSKAELTFFARPVAQAEQSLKARLLRSIAESD